MNERPQGAADYEADKRNMNWGSYEDDKARGLVEWVHEQIYELKDAILELQMENTLLRNDLNIIKNEGCCRFIENPEHPHRRDNE